MIFPGPQAASPERPRHTPYDGGHPLFRIGLSPLDLADWIEVDERLDAYLAEKARLTRLDRDAVFAAEAGSEDAQAEVLALLVRHLPQRFPAIYRLEGSTMDVGGRRVDLSASPPLERAAAMVQEDLLLMRRGEAGWRLAAGSLCFPSSWRLREKFGLPLQEIHAPVPDFGPKTRNAGVITRIFDNLKPDQPVRRMNWSIYGNDRLHHPEREGERLELARGSGELLRSFLRVEYQTLRKLAVSGDILFTVRIHLDPIRCLETHPDRARLVAGLIAALRGLDDRQLAYKGLQAVRDRLTDEIAVLGAVEAAIRS